MLFYSDYLKQDVEHIRTIQKENLKKNQSFMGKVTSIFRHLKPNSTGWERDYFDMQNEYGIDHRGTLAFVLEQNWRMSKPVAFRLSSDTVLNGLPSTIEADTLPAQFLILLSKDLAVGGYWLPSILVSISSSKENCLYEKSINKTMEWLGKDETYEVEREKGLSITLTYQSPPNELSSWVVSALNTAQIEIATTSLSANEYNNRCTQKGLQRLDDSGEAEEEYVNEFIFRANQTALAAIHQISTNNKAGGLGSYKKAILKMGGHEVAVKEYKL